MSSSLVACAKNGICGIRTWAFQAGKPPGYFRRGGAVGGEAVDALGTHAADPGPPIEVYLGKTAVNP